MPYANPREVAAKKLVGARIRHARAAKTMSQVALAAAMKRTQGVVSEWETGQRRVGVEETWTLSQVLGISVERLLGPPTTNAEHQTFNAQISEARKLIEEAKASRYDP
jgi:transcriptional regulator with XRE-family HTH domain